MSQLNEALQTKWESVIDHPDLPQIADPHRRAVTATLLENTKKALEESANIGAFQSLTEAAPTNNISGGNIGTFDPVLISLVRRAAPNLMAYDIAGVQPMTGPTGLIFALKSRYTAQNGTEALFNEPDTSFSTLQAANTTFGEDHTGTSPVDPAYNVAGGMETAELEALGSNPPAFNEMAFSIDKVSVEAKARALKAEYSLEMAQDLKAVHGLDAEAELTNILASEILAEMNREVVRTVYITAKAGSQTDTAVQGVFNLDTDANGRWSVEKFKGLMYHLEREANVIAKETRRGKGNILVCSSDVASALSMAGVLDATPALQSNNLQVDDTGNTFAGVMNGRFRVYIDPYTTSNFAVVGYKGVSAFDAGLFYCPYVPLQMVRAINQDTFQPSIGFKTRYGMVANPFHLGSGATSSALTPNSNVYYRKSAIANLM